MYKNMVGADVLDIGSVAVPLCMPEAHSWRTFASAVDKEAAVDFARLLSD